ncbi:hypothetical protein [Streptomyces sp. NPDC057682]|uniref:hypothetical protein n=1 Tax=unclassified Streptomyces TaxID=2593676 RepID=UPI0036681317
MVRRWVPALVLGGVWWWAVLRLVLEPAHAGVVEGAVAAGGWGLSLLPVHVAATARPIGIFDAGTRLLRRCADGVREAGRSWRTRVATGRSWAPGRAWRATRAWRRRRSGGGSGPS